VRTVLGLGTREVREAFSRNVLTSVPIPECRDDAVELTGAELSKIEQGNHDVDRTNPLSGTEKGEPPRGADEATHAPAF
jgi:hypothetical protein